MSEITLNCFFIYFTGVDAAVAQTLRKAIRAKSCPKSQNISLICFVIVPGFEDIYKMIKIFFPKS